MIVKDLEALPADLITAPKPALQPGRLIATARSPGTPLAFMTPEGDARPPLEAEYEPTATLDFVPLSDFSPVTRDWFLGAFEAPTRAQAQAWPAIASGEHVLISAPTGSGKTLAAFLWGSTAWPPPTSRPTIQGSASSTSRR